MTKSVRLLLWLAAMASTIQTVPAHTRDLPLTRVYENRLKAISNAPPILGDYPEFVEPVREVARFEAPRLIDDPGADLEVRGWRFSYNARGIIEVPKPAPVEPDGRHCGASLGYR